MFDPSKRCSERELKVLGVVELAGSVHFETELRAGRSFRLACSCLTDRRLWVSQSSAILGVARRPGCAGPHADGRSGVLQSWS
jgi:hypothetical protein